MTVDLKQFKNFFENIEEFAIVWKIPNRIIIFISPEAKVVAEAVVIGSMQANDVIPSAAMG